MFFKSAQNASEVFAHFFVKLLLSSNRHIKLYSYLSKFLQNFK